MKLPDGLFEELLDAAPDALLVSATDGTIRYANAQAEALFGYSRDELIGRQVEDLIPARLSSVHREHRLSYEKSPRVRAMGHGGELLARGRDGTEIPVEIRLGPLKTPSGALISTVIRDVTERRVIQQATVAARAEAERANRAKSAFLAMASHDLRQPLQSLVLLTDVLRREARSPRLRSAVEAQASALHSVMGLLNALLDVSKLEAGAVSPRIADVGVQPLFERLSATFAHLAHGKGLELRVQPTAETVRSDAVLLERMIQNLLANAVRYTDRGVVELRCRADADECYIEVEDTGPGIPADQFDVIFQEFSRLPGAPEEGLGLGLAIVRRTADLLGHRVEVHSTLGEGSCFAICVQRSYGVVHPAERTRASSGRPRESRTILAVDDDEMIGMALRMLLEAEGYVVDVAHSVDEARDRLERRRAPDLVLTDYRLGRRGKTGFDVIEVARELGSTEMPVIMMTGDTSPKVAAAARVLDGVVLIAKPFTADELLAAVERSLT